MSTRLGIEELEAMRRMREEYLAQKGSEGSVAKDNPDTISATEPSSEGITDVMLREPANGGLPQDYVPSEEELLAYLNKWDTLNVYVEHEKALQSLFRPNGEMSTSTDLSKVIIKCAVLNDFYATNIYQVEPIARHIAGISDIDAMLEQGNPELVGMIARAEGVKNFNYSFATKYCSHHNPDAFPIFDRYVGDVLWFLNKKYPALLSLKKRDDLKDYPTFVDVIRKVRDNFGLSKYSFKDIDRYLWQLGKDFYNPYVKK